MKHNKNPRKPRSNINTKISITILKNRTDWM